MKQLQWFAVLFVALAFSAWLGRAELHTDDTGILVGLIGIGGFALAILEPRYPWLWGVLVPAGIILVEVWNHKGGVGGLIGIAAFTVAIACVAAYAGAFIRQRVSPSCR